MASMSGACGWAAQPPTISHRPSALEAAFLLRPRPSRAGAHVESSQLLAVGARAHHRLICCHPAAKSHRTTDNRLT
eukprot:scaffold14375_cov133-Isochrysis_galbana.AAC.9